MVRLLFGFNSLFVALFASTDDVVGHIEDFESDPLDLVGGNVRLIP